MLKKNRKIQFYAIFIKILAITRLQNGTLISNVRQIVGKSLKVHLQRTIDFIARKKKTEI